MALLEVDFYSELTSSLLWTILTTTAWVYSSDFEHPKHWHTIRARWESSPMIHDPVKRKKHDAVTGASLDFQPHARESRKCLST